MTFSILARDETTGQLGVATATHAYGVGGVANFAKAGVGVVATQSFVEVSYGPNGLDLLEMGIGAREALTTLVTADPDQDIRQVAYIDTTGAVAEHTGKRCVPSCGSVVAGQTVAIGNMLDNDRVLPAMSEAFGSADGDLAERLMTALEAGERAGGDARGRMSASLRVVAAEPAVRSWQGTRYDLRIDVDPEPVRALRTSLGMSRAYQVFFRSVFAPGLVTGPEPVTGAALEEALAGLEATQRHLGEDLEPTVWQGVLLLRAGQTERGCALLAKGLAARPQFARFLDGLAEIGTISMTSAEILQEAQR
jgi:uncharacterized Ntn-hydrolase superfamily protein